MTARSPSIQTYARTAGVVFLIAIVAGGFGEAYAPSQLVVVGNAAATAHNLVTSNVLFRVGFVAYLGEAITDVALTFLLYVLLRPVHANLALLAVLFRIMATATFAFAELFYFAPSLILSGDGYLKVFATDQLQALALLSMNVYSAGGNVFNVFYGIGSIIIGYLMFRSGYLPKVLAGLWFLSGFGFVIASLLSIFARAEAAFFLLPQITAIVLLGFWLLIRGIDVKRWNEAAQAVDGERAG